MKFRATSESRRSPPGSWSIASASHSIMDLSIRCFAAKWKLTKPSSVASQAYAQSERAANITGTGCEDKAIVLGIMERGEEVRTKVAGSRKKKAFQAEVGLHVEAGSVVYTDALKSYEGLGEVQQ